MLNLRQQITECSRNGVILFTDLIYKVMNFYIFFFLKLPPTLIFLSLRSLLEVLALCQRRLRAVPHLYPVPGWCKNIIRDSMAWRTLSSLFLT